MVGVTVAFSLVVVDILGLYFEVWGRATTALVDVRFGLELISGAGSANIMPGFYSSSIGFKVPYFWAEPVPLIGIRMRV